MATVQEERQLSVEELLGAANQLPPEQREEFVSRLLLVQARRGPLVAPTEKELLAKINAGLLATAQKRFNSLNIKRRAGKLSAAEHKELLDLVQQSEQLEGQRLEALVELARIRQTSLHTLMAELGLHPPPDLTTPGEQYTS